MNIIKRYKNKCYKKKILDTFAGYVVKNVRYNTVGVNTKYVYYLYHDRGTSDSVIAEHLKILWEDYCNLAKKYDIQFNGTSPLCKYIYFSDEKECESFLKDLIEVVSQRIKRENLI